MRSRCCCACRSLSRGRGMLRRLGHASGRHFTDAINREDRKSTRLNSSHLVISYAVFCLKKKKHTQCIKDLVREINYQYPGSIQLDNEQTILDANRHESLHLDEARHDFHLVVQTTKRRIH